MRRRADGYHDIESIFVPLRWCDELHIGLSNDHAGHFEVVGNDGLSRETAADNLVMKALRAIEKHVGRHLPPFDIRLVKHVPLGAGLGGGSADAAFTLIGVNGILNLQLDKNTLASIAATIGADCPFFIYNRPMLVQGIGDVMQPVELPQLDGLHIVAIKLPGTEVSTRQAYAGAIPAELPVGTDLVAAAQLSPAEWSDNGLINDFEVSVMAVQPRLTALRREMERMPGAVYTAMSGSGSTIYSLFADASEADKCATALRTKYPDADIFTDTLQ